MSELKPILDLLGGHASWLLTLITWLGVLAPFSALLGTKFRHSISDRLNEIAASSDQDDDEFLRALFAQRRWKIAALISRFTPFHLPTLADLERAIRFQNEARAEHSSAAVILGQTQTTETK